MEVYRVRKDYWNRYCVCKMWQLPNSGAGLLPIKGKAVGTDITNVTDECEVRPFIINYSSSTFDKFWMSWVRGLRDIDNVRYVLDKWPTFVVEACQLGLK